VIGVPGCNGINSPICALDEIVAKKIQKQTSRDRRTLRAELCWMSWTTGTLLRPALPDVSRVPLIQFVNNTRELIELMAIVFAALKATRDRWDNCG